MKGLKENSNKKGVGILVVIFVLILAATLVTGCSSSKNATVTPGSSILPIANKTNASSEKTNTNEIKMTGVLTYLNAADLKMHYIDVESGEEYEVNYTGGTDIQNKYKAIISASQMTLGDVYDVTCNKNGKTLSIYESGDVWESSGVTKLNVDEPSLIMTIGATNYKYSSNTVVISNGNKIGATEILSQDVVTVRGNGKTVYSVTVDKGHGYVKFTGVTPFIGGYVDIGTNLILPVSDGMMVTAPEGEYKVSMQLGSLKGSKTVVIERNKDITVDFSEFKPEAVQSGAVLFSITPSSAVMYIDGTQVDYSSAIQLTYGTHKLVLKANNYTTYTESFIVKSTYEKKPIDMVAASSTSTTSSGSTTKASTVADLTSGYSVNVKSPEGAAVYVDSVYVGIAPVAFKKSSGNKVVTLTKAGCSTKSYSLSIANAAGDLNYAFPAMEAEAMATISAK